MDIITIQGPSACGKSTLTRLLREELDYAYVDRPMIKRGLKPIGRQEALRLSKDATYHVIRQLIERGDDIIAQEVNPESLKKHVDLKGYRLVPFYIKCPVETALERDRERPGKTHRPELIRRIHEEYPKPADYEIIIDTEKMTIQESLDYMMGHI